MDSKRLVKVSKYLSKHLRHEPERLGLTLAAGGWVEVEALLQACAGSQFPVSRAELDEVVATSDKRRFSFDATGTRIRANQGHSTDVDLQLEPAAPPPILYHGTALRNCDSVKNRGLHKMARHHVHLSATIEAARTVGARRGTPVVFAVDAAKMAADGFVFYCSANGVWLADHVPPAYLRML
jgi:putative RNA 2'-phosphotransferase